jgi:hypothetical protein
LFKVVIVIVKKSRSGDWGLIKAELNAHLELNTKKLLCGFILTRFLFIDMLNLRYKGSISIGRMKLAKFFPGK